MGGPELSHGEALLARLAGVERVHFDTNALIYFLAGVEPHASLLVPLLEAVSDGDVGAGISCLVELELRVKPLRDGDAAALRQIDLFLTEVGIEPLAVTPPVARRAAGLRAEHGLHVVDAVILATAEADAAVLVGNDRKAAAHSPGRYVLLEERAP